jgi:hypothetical protein
VVDTATAKEATFPKKERALRREIASDLMISLMVKTPRRPVNAHADANSKVPVLIYIKERRH